jgi:hypothetical protein
MRSYLISLLICWSFSVNAFAQREPEAPLLPNIDQRETSAKKLNQNQSLALENLKSKLPSAEIELNQHLTVPNWIKSEDDFLTGPDGTGKSVESGAFSIPSGDPQRGALAFVNEYRDLFGFDAEELKTSKVKRDFVTPHNQMRTTVWEQQVQGIPVFEALLAAHHTQNGELINISGHFIQKQQALVAQFSSRFVSILPEQAIVNGLAQMGETDLQLPTPSSLPTGEEKRQNFKAHSILEEATVSLTWLPLSDSDLRLCWQIEMTPRLRNEMYRLLVDANSGEILVRHSLTEYISNATYRVFTSDSPSPFSPGHSSPSSIQPPLVPRSLVTTNAMSLVASPNGWINDGGNETRGNNVDAHLDRNGDNLADLPRPQGSPFRVFDRPLNLTQDPTSYSLAAVIQLFYWNNFMHDKLYALGFTEAAGNFQINNFGRGGLGNDAVQADAQDGSGLNNANFSTPSDGSAPRMQMFIFSGPNPNRDGDLDAEIVLHEYTHGLSNRLVGHGVGISALQTRGMGEGWSDFYAMSLLSKATDNFDGNYAMGGYATYQLGGLTQNYYFGIRRYPYSTNLIKNPLTFKDLDPAKASPHSGIPRNPIIGVVANEVHNMGELWCVTLWEMRVRLIKKYGFNVGNNLALKLVTDAMKLGPANPNYIQARDAVMQADLVNNARANRDLLWAAFAKRGMGANASSPGSSTTSGIIESFVVPDHLVIRPATGMITRGPIRGPFSPPSQIFTIKNDSPAPLNWTVTKNATWLNLSSFGGTLASGASLNLTATINSLANSLAIGVYSGTLRFSNTTNGTVQTRTITLRVGLPDYYTELFAANDNDLDNQTLIFTPDGSANYYSTRRVPATAFPVSPVGGTAVFLGDDSFAQVNLTGGAKLLFYGVHYSTIFIGSNGYITFTAGDTNFEESLSKHFMMPRISALFDDLNPTAGGVISYKQLADRMVVTYQNIREFGANVWNNFQIEMFFNGKVRITYLGVSAVDGLAGLSRGQGVPPNFVESDLTLYPPTAPVAPSGLTATTLSRSQIKLSWVDNSTNETQFRIERKVGATGTYALLGVVGANVVTFIDSNLTSGVKYFYRIRASNTGGNSVYSNEASAITF